MVLGINEIYKRIRKYKLIENLSERELSNPEGAGIDFRIGKVFRLKGRSFLGIDERQTAKPILIAEYSSEEKRTVNLKPGDYVLTETIEKLNMPNDLVALPSPRTTLHRSGIAVRLGTVAPGYSGTLHPALHNAGPEVVTFEMGARYINVLFLLVKGKTNQYRGQWQGGRISATKRERQV